MKSLYFVLLLTIIVPSLTAQTTIYQVREAEPLSAKEIAERAQKMVMCTASPALEFTACTADDRNDPNSTVDPGSVAFSIIGGVGPTFRVEFFNQVTNQMLFGVGDDGNGNFVYNPANGRDLQFSFTTVSGDCIQAGPIEITIIDGEGCEVSCVVNFFPTCTDFSPNLSVDVTQPECGVPTGSISLTVSTAGDNGYCLTATSGGDNSVDWSTGASDVMDLSNLNPGFYDVTVTDFYGCTASITGIEIESVEDLTINACTPTNSTAFGADDGMVLLSWSGATPTYTVQVCETGSPCLTFSTDDQFLELNNLGPGDYEVFISDQATGFCFADCEFTIEEPACTALTVPDPDITNVDCAGSNTGSIDLDIPDGAIIEVIQWTGPDGFFSFNEDINNLAPGNYRLNISRPNGCPSFFPRTYTITQPDSLLIDCSATESDFQANNGTITIDVMGGTPPYQVDYNGTVVNDYTSGTTIMDVAPDTYNVIVTDMNGCEATCEVEVTEVNCLLTAMVSQTNPVCPGDSTGSIALTIENATGLVEIEWSVPGFADQPTATTLPAGEYFAIVNDEACTLDTIFITLTEPLPISIEINPMGTLQCHGDSTVSLTTVITNGLPPFSYVWEGIVAGDVDQVNMVPAGQFIVNVTDATGCVATDTIDITQPADLTLSCSPTGETTSGANDGMITIDYTGAGPFNISGDLTENGLTLMDSPFTFNNLMPATYNLTITDANGCTETCTAVVNVGGCIMTLEQSTTGFDCPTPTTGQIRVTPVNGTPPYTYAWTNTTNTDSIAENLTANQYTVIVTDANSCTAQFDTTLVEFTNFPTFSLVAAPTICADGCQDFTYSASGTGQIELVTNLVEASSNDTIAFINVVLTEGMNNTFDLCPTDYGLTSFDGHFFNFERVTDEACETVLDSDNSPVFFPFATDTIRQNFCNGDTPTFQGMMFDQNNPYAEFNLTSANGCDSLLVVDLSFFDAVPGTVDTTVCPGGSITIEGRTLNAASPPADFTFTSATPSALGCDSVITVNLSFHPAATGTVDTLVCEGASVTIEGNVVNAANNGFSFVSATPSVNGCDSTVTVNLSFRPPVTGTVDTLVCEGGSVTIEGNTFNAANSGTTFVSATPSVNGCDSTVTVNLSFRPPVTGTVDTLVCEGGSVTIEGNTFNAANSGTTFVSATPSVNGCDSTVTVNLSFRP
ncbi:MAG: hypothetical protein AAF828_10965, partial [Bacteroidota bacterium]